MSAAGASPALRCLGGEVAPPGVADDLAALAALGEPALAALGPVVRAALREPPPREMEPRLDAFCVEHGVDGERLARGVRAARFLLRAAAAASLDRAALEADLVAVAPAAAPAVAPVLLALVDAASAIVQAEAFARALVDHGKLVTSVEWRVDRVAASRAGRAASTPVALLTLGYHEGASAGRVTLQALPETVLELREACDAILRLR